MMDGCTIGVSSVRLVFTFFHDDTIKEGNEVGLKILVEIMDAVEQMLI